MRAGYRAAQCKRCGRLFPTLARAPQAWCSLACSSVLRPWIRRRSA